MKCEVSVRVLEEYVDGELVAREARQISAHLSACSDCASEVAALTAEQELLERYDRDIHVPSSLWKAVAARTMQANSQYISVRARIASLFRGRMTRLSFAGATAVVLLAVTVGVAFRWLNRSSPRKEVSQAHDDDRSRPFADLLGHPIGPVEQSGPLQVKRAGNVQPKQTRRLARKPVRSDQPDVLSSQFAYADLADRDTAKHIEQSQNLLRSIRNFPVPDNDDQIDISYDKALSRRLLGENIILRREAEMRANLPAKILLSDLEPFLIDIANLPDQPTPGELRVIKERVQKTEIVAALLSY